MVSVLADLTIGAQSNPVNTTSSLVRISTSLKLSSDLCRQRCSTAVRSDWADKVSAIYVLELQNTRLTK